MLLLGTIFSTALLSLLSCHCLESFSTELCPAAASPKPLLLYMVIVRHHFFHSSPLCIQGRMSKVSHYLACQRMAKFACLCCDLLPKEKVEQTEHRCVVTYTVLLRHGQVTTSVSAAEQVKGTLHSKLTLLICMGTGKYRNDREKLFPCFFMLERQKYMHIWLRLQIMVSEVVVK